LTIVITVPTEIAVSKYEALLQFLDRTERAICRMSFREIERVWGVARKVTFRHALAGSSAKRDPWGCMAGTVIILPATDLTAPSGESWTAEEGRLLNE
jgi:hypothetical protein